MTTSFLNRKCCHVMKCKSSRERSFCTKDFTDPLRAPSPPSTQTRIAIFFKTSSRTLRISSLQDLQDLQDFQSPGFPVSRISNLQDVRSPGFPISRISSFQDLQFSVFPISRIPNLQDLQSPGSPGFEMLLFPLLRLIGRAVGHFKCVLLSRHGSLN